MNTMTKTLLVAALSLTTLSLSAQSDERPGRPEGRGHRVPPMMAALDANHDGVIDSTELSKVSTVLAGLDKNSDGQLTADELRPGGPEGGKPPGGGEGRPEGRPAGKGRGVPPFIAAIDANSDGVIDAAEIANAATALASLDANKDGQLTQDELRPAKHEGQGEGDRGQGPRGKRGPRGPRPEAPAGE